MALRSYPRVLSFWSSTRHLNPPSSWSSLSPSSSIICRKSVSTLTSARIFTRQLLSTSTTNHSFTTVGPTLYTRSFSTANKDDKLRIDRKEVEARILQICKKFEKLEGKEVTKDSSFAQDLDLDSLDVVELLIAVETEFNIEMTDKEADSIHDIPGAIDYIANHNQVNPIYSS